MSRTRLYDCLSGRKTFTRAEKKAISANIIAKVISENVIDYEQLELASEAWSGKFDEIYRRKEMI